MAADFHRDAWLVTASLHRSAGLGSASSVRRPNTLTVVPVVPALTVAEAGVTYQFLQTTHGTQLNAQLLFRHQLTVVESRSDWKLFGANLRSSQLLLAVPVSQHLGRLTLQGHLGTTILSRHQTSYDLLLRVYEESLERPVSHPTLVRYEAGAPTTWLAQVGAAFALGDVLVSTAVHAERTTLRRVYEETVWGLELSVGWGR